MILKYPRLKSRVHSWAHNYALIAKYKGVMSALEYAKRVIPPQFDKQVSDLAKEEYVLLKDKKDDTTD